MFIKHTFLFVSLFSFMFVHADSRSSLSYCSDEAITSTQIVKLVGNESFLYRISEEENGNKKIQRANDLTHITVSQSVWDQAIKLSRAKVTIYEGSDDACLDFNAQKSIASANTENQITVLLHTPKKGKSTDLINTFDLTQMLKSGKEQIKLAMLLAQTKEQENIISKAARESGIEWRQKATFTTQKIWARHQFEITGALYMGGFFCADLLLQKIWSCNPYAATALYGVTMSYQLWNSRHWGDFNQSTAALGALGALSFARYKGLLRF